MPLMIRRWLASTGCVLALCACTSEPKVRVDEAYTPPPPRAIELRTNFAPGDALQVEYSRNFPAMASYPLGAGDQIEIEVLSHPELTLDTTVAPDGTISFHQVGTISAAGRTVEELRVQLTAALTPVVPNPMVSVFLKQSDMRVARFLELLLSHPSGALREVRVGPEGSVSLPGIGRVQIAGLDAEQTQELFNTRLHEELPTLSVYVSMKSQSGDVFTVWGEVAKPGRYTMDGEYSLVEALAAAGGATPVGDLEKVVVMNFPVGKEPAIATLYNVSDAFAHGQSMSGVRIRPRDTVFVLRTGIGDVNSAIDLYIRRNLPFNIGVTYRLNP